MSDHDEYAETVVQRAGSSSSFTSLDSVNPGAVNSIRMGIGVAAGLFGSCWNAFSRSVFEIYGRVLAWAIHDGGFAPVWIRGPAHH